MRRSSVSVLLVLVVVLVSLLAAGCGSGSTPPPRVPAKVVLAPSSLSLGHGLIAQVTAIPLDANDQAMSGLTITYRSSNTDLVTVSSTGEVCGGKWDTNFFNCAPGPVGIAEVTATAGGVTSDPIKVYVHKRVDRITVEPASGPCFSQEESQEFTATAFSSNEDITDTVGPVFWRSTALPVARLDTSDLPNNKVKVTGERPGRTVVSASIGNVISLPATFQTCSPASIAVREKDGSETSFELEVQQTQQLEAEVIDTKGNPIEDLPLTWRSLNVPVAGVTDTGLINPLRPGLSTIVASCSVPDCLLGVNEAHFSNVIRVKVPGATQTTVYAAGTASKKVIPIPTDTHTPGTAIELPHEPNSFLFAPHAARAYLGSSEALMVLLATANTVTTHTIARGRVLAVSLTRAVVSDTTNSRVYIWDDANQGILATLPLANVTQAAIAHDDSRIFLLAGSTLYVWSPAPPALRTIALSAPATRVTLLANSALAYFAGGTADNIMVRNVCDTALVHSLTVPSPPELMAAIPDNSGILALNPPDLRHISVQLAGATCDPVVVDTVQTRDLGAGAFTPRQIIVTTDARRAFITADQGSVLVYDIETGDVSAIALQDGASEAFRGGATLDAKTLYVGSDQGVHRINIETATDEQRIELDFTPDLVAVRPQ